MPTATIRVQYVNPPKAPKGPGSIKDTEGNMWTVWPDLLGSFEIGRSCKIDYDTKTYRDKPQHTVKVVKPIDEAPQPAATGSIPSPVNTAPAPKKTYSSPYGSTDMATAERIFVCGALNAMLSNATLVQEVPTTQKIIGAVNILRAAWRNTFGGPEKQDDMNDELPESFR